MTIWVEESISSYVIKQNSFPRVLSWVLIVSRVKYNVHTNMNYQIYLFLCYEKIPYAQLCELIFYNLIPPSTTIDIWNKPT